MMLSSKPASNQQIGYIERLRTENNETGPSVSRGTTGNKTSKIIQRLMVKQCDEINDIWLSLAMKECFHPWNGLGRDIYSVHREPYIERVIETYQLFASVAERLNTGR